MATSSVAYNKPVLPRVSDTSDLASNRASVYSGKGLSFDGVNDSLDFSDNNDLDLQEFSVVQYVNVGASTVSRIFYSNYNNSNGYGFATGISDSTSNVPKFYTKSASSSNTLFGSFPLVNGQWYQIVATYDGSTKKIYINGVLDTSVSYTSGISYSGATSRIGALSGVSGQFFNGKLNGFKIFNSALTSTQVAELYNNPEQILPTGVSAVNLKLWLPMMEGAGSYVYNGAAGSLGTELVSNGGFDEVCQKWGITDNGYATITNGKVVWNAPNGSGANVVQYLSGIQAGKTYRVSFDYSVNRDGFGVQLGDYTGAVTSTNTGTGRFTTDITVGNANGGYFLLNMSAGTGDLVGYMDNVSVKEVVPQATGTISGATWVAGLPEPLPQTALMDWNKTTNNVVFSNAFTSSGWLSNFSVNNKLFGYTNPFGAPTAWKISIPSGASYYLYRTLSGFSAGSVTMSGWFRADAQVTIGFNDGSAYPNSITVGQEWERKSFTFTYSGAGIGIQMDNYFGVSPSAQAKEFYVYGLQATQGSTVQPYIETFDNAQTSPVLIPKGLTTGKDIFGNSIAVTRSSGAFNFDGYSWAYIDENASHRLASTDNITLEGWFRYTSDGRTGGRPIFGKRWAESNWLRFYYTDAGTLKIEGAGGGGQAATIYPNIWYHIVGVATGGGTLTLYKDGVLIGSTTVSGYTMDFGGALEIGAWSSEYKTNGQLSNVRVYPYALTAEQVADNYNQKATTFGGSTTISELQAYINRTNAAGATVEAHPSLLNTLTELESK